MNPHAPQHAYQRDAEFGMRSINRAAWVMNHLYPNRTPRSIKRNHQVAARLLRAFGNH